ncbi:hypothetical protein [Streptomyces sp. NPDC006739]|uniref:hypothetical protein n=1 Tax=Streptomyces sp. NPDC006739 TaxID=3364763 RepID=UPI003696D520
MVIVSGLLVGGGAWLATRGGSGEAAQRTPVLPNAFGAYKEAKAGDTEWKQDAVVNTDIAKGEVNLTYRASGGRALIIRARFEPQPTPGSEESGDTLYSVLDSTIDQRRVKTYPAGAVGGKIQCAVITVGGSAFTTCGWRNGTTYVTLAPVLNHDLIVSGEAPRDLRNFVNALKITPPK